jgi:hypothetical protein
MFIFIKIDIIEVSLHNITTGTARNIQNIKVKETHLKSL